MTIWKMFTVGIKNCLNNWKNTLLFGILISFGLALFSEVPSFFVNQAVQQEYYSFAVLAPFFWMLSLAVTVLRPALTTLPLLISYTKPPRNGPQDFKGRLKQKFGPFMLLGLIWAGILVAIFVIWVIVALFFAAFVGAVYAASYSSFDSFGPMFFILLLILIIPIYLVATVLQCAVYYSYITLATENIKVGQAFSRGFQMLSKHLGRSIGNYLCFSLMACTIPIVLVIISFYYLIEGLIRFPSIDSAMSITLLIPFWIFIILLVYAAQCVLTASMVELYRKNWLEDHSLPLYTPFSQAVRNASTPSGGWNPPQPIQPQPVTPPEAHASETPPVSHRPEFDSPSQPPQPENQSPSLEPTHSADGENLSEEPRNPNL